MEGLLECMGMYWECSMSISVVMQYLWRCQVRARGAGHEGMFRISAWLKASGRLVGSLYVIWLGSLICVTISRSPLERHMPLLYTLRPPPL